MLLVLLPLTALAAFTALKWERFSQQSPHNQEFCCTIILPHWVLLAAVAVQKKKKEISGDRSHLLPQLHTPGSSQLSPAPTR